MELETGFPDEPGDVARLTFFSDAAVAIALTLLILPVSDYILENPGTNWTTLFTDNPEMIQSVVSFVTILTCWRYHHVLFEWLRDYSRVTVWLNFGWLFCVVSIPLLTLAILPAGDSESRGYRRFLDTLVVRGETNISVQNYFVYWFVVGLSFLALFFISRHASVAERGLAKPGTNLATKTWVYLRPVLVCAATALTGLINPALGDVVLIVGIVGSSVIARRTRPEVRSAAH